MGHAPTPPVGLPRLIDLETLAAYLGVPVATVYDWRGRRLGPPAYRIGKRLMFAVPDVQAWVEQQRDHAGGDACLGPDYRSAPPAISP